MSGDEIRDKVAAFIVDLVKAQDSHYNFDFFLHVDMDTDGESVRRLSYSTYRDMGMYELGVLMVDEIMHDRSVRNFEGLNPNDVVYNHYLRSFGMDGFIVN